MSEESKDAVELKEEELEKVNGGFSGNNYEKPTIDYGDRVRVRYTDTYGHLVYAYGTSVGTTSQAKSVCGKFKMMYFIDVKLDGYEHGKSYPAGDVEPA